METTIGNSNPALWKYVSPNTVLEGIRTVVANRLAKSGYEWATIFDSGFNSGTYVHFFSSVLVFRTFHSC